jgi:nucleoid-associated protein YgaU
MPEPRSDIGDTLRKSGVNNVPPSSGPTAQPAGASSLGHGYQVQSGDTLSKIAKRVYGDASEWKRIWEANKDTIPNPDLIHPGQQINLPPK